MSVSPTLRGFAIIVAIAAVVTALQLGAGVVVVLRFVQVLFVVAIAYVLLMLWLRRREEIAEWSRRARLVFYGGAALALAAVAILFFPWLDRTGADTAAALLALGAGVFAAWRVWRDEHTYGY